MRSFRTGKTLIAPFAAIATAISTNTFAAKLALAGGVVATNPQLMKQLQSMLP